MDATISAKLLSIGLGAWIQYERACKRTEVFGESYLSYPISQLLNSHTKHRVISEFRHPVLAPTIRGPGRRPTTDFVVCDHQDRVSVAIETKWVGSTRPSPKDILWDLIRLELIRLKYDANCFFILGGQKKKIEPLFDMQGFIDKKRKGWRKPLLRIDSNTQNAILLDSSDAFRRSILREIYSSQQNRELPTKLATRRATPFPPDAGNQDYQVFVWELVATNNQMMKPTNSIHFHKNTG